MIKNYIKIALRNLTRHKLYSLLNIGGLAIGLSVCMMIMLYVAHEMSFDRFHVNAKRIFALDEHLQIGSQEVNFQYTSYVSGPLIQQSVPDVVGYMRTRKVFKDVIVENPSLTNTKFSEGKMFFCGCRIF